MSILKIGVIGTGVMGRGHAEFIRGHIPSARVVAISDVDQSSMDSLVQDLGGDVSTFTSPEEMIKSVGLDALIIASPDGLHVTHLRLAMAANLPTLCEKPIATNLEDARAIAAEIAIFESKLGKRSIHFGFMRRFDPSYIELKSMMDSGTYGQALFVRTITRNVSSVGITTEGLYTNIAVHDFDIWRWMLNDEWASVSSHYPKPSSLSPAGLIDPLVFSAKLLGGVLVVGDIVANNNYGYDLRTEVVCEKGSLEIGIFGDVIKRANHVAEVAIGGPMVENWIPRFEDAYIAELKAWVESVTTGNAHSDLATSADALAATEACFLALKSIK